MHQRNQLKRRKSVADGMVQNCKGTEIFAWFMSWAVALPPCHRCDGTNNSWAPGKSPRAGETTESTRCDHHGWEISLSRSNYAPGVLIALFFIAVWVRRSKNALLCILGLRQGDFQ
jgi:hypothetical protein